MRALAVCVLCACSTPQTPPARADRVTTVPVEVIVRTDAAVAVAQGERIPSVPIDAGVTLATPGDAAPPGVCTADLDHCCDDDGTVVKPGGCSPRPKGGSRPSEERGPGGWCIPKPCHKKCLPETALIATPEGDRAIIDLAVGDLVYTVDEQGARVARPIAALGSVDVTDHALAVVTLDDGRVVRASPLHPTRDGTPLGGLAPGDLLDGARVLETRLVPYDRERTWDLRPEGPTGLYWADGVLLGSTIEP